MLTLLFQAVVSGILLGIIYGVIGIGMNMIYGVMRVVNFAHGEFMMLAAYLCFTIGQVYGLNPLFSVWVIMPCFFVVGFVLYYLLVPRLLESEDPEMASFLTFVGVSLILTAALLFIWGADPRSIPFPFKRVSVFVGDLFFPLGRLISAAFCGVSIVALVVFLYRTYTGKAIRAIIQNRDAVAILGIDANRLSALCFGIGLLLVALAGSLVILSFPAITPVMGPSYTLVAFVIIVLGGLGSPQGALVGGIAFGLAENVAAVFVSAALAPVIAFLILIVMIFWRPQGLLGQSR